ncbi:glycosyltransferase [Pedobacter frigidisoli]|uniref:Glycosyltransferase n=1 Tax=Pedobacter frigidisoli TaxID=2530455 RepID=A0A4R0NMT2_9SPHI|nr:glycosyltransferase family 2 protein [Pedobacter frigidisoli]TCD02192.1 glycosyltransferase [Pedobacter frigidisoli]
MKISVITVVFNGELFLEACIQSVFEQTYPNVEYIVIDGGSTDRTLAIIDLYSEKIDYFISEKDRGLYDAINKGIKEATGEVIGILNGDDVFAGKDILQAIAEKFIMDPTIDGVYGDLNYVHPYSGRIIRKWKSKQARFVDLEKGWMPAHPTLYLKRKLFAKYGTYALDLGTTADYDLILRFLYKYKLKAVYIAKLMVNMRLGGVSNGSLKGVLNAVCGDFVALRRNGIPLPLFALIRKKLGKLSQFLR